VRELGDGCSQWSGEQEHLWPKNGEFCVVVTVDAAAVVAIFLLTLGCMLFTGGISVKSSELKPRRYFCSLAMRAVHFSFATVKVEEMTSHFPVRCAEVIVSC